ncbi:MAG: PKD domain-containing protein [Deltaproteobacteria bacterium]|nr:PKD domain-containing protein [Deltaproteobacteria bacterium]
MTRSRWWMTMAGTVWALPAVSSGAQWNGLTDASDALGTDTYAFFGSHPGQINSNENYYDGDFGDFDGDGVMDRSLGARYGLLMNTGDGQMIPYAGLTNYLLRGMPGAQGWGEDAFQWADVDGDGDLDNLSGGNGEPLTLQINREGRFSASWQLSRSALNIVNTDVDGDGDLDLAVAHAFCANASCGGPVQFSLLINDGTGVMSEESAARGVGIGNGEFVVGVVSGDIDGDGDYDLLWQRGVSGSPEGAAGVVEVAVNDGTGNYTLQPTDLVTTCSGFGQAFNLGDIDDDGDLDVVMGRCPYFIDASGHPTVAHVVGINDGTGTIVNESMTRWDTAGWTEPLAGGNSSLVDIDYDGDLDYVALRTDSADFGLGIHTMQVFLNDGTGVFVYSVADTVDFVSQGSALGADADITDLDGDGTYDVWLGMGGDRVRIMLNSVDTDDGLPADVPRNLSVVEATGSGVRVRWQAPPFAATARHYRVYRSTSPSLDHRDRRLVKVVGQPNQDEGFFDPITRHTTTAQLGDPDVELFGDQDAIEFLDSDVVPGVTYQYAVTHVGAENTESRPSTEVFAVVPGGAESGEGPVVDIVSPTNETWWSHPRVVIHFGDGGSGVDPASVQVSFDEDLGNPAAGGRAAGDNVADLAYRLDAGALVLALEPPLTLPDLSLVTMTVTVADMDGNTTMETQQLFVSPVAAQMPDAVMSASTLAGDAPLAVDFDGSGSSDADGQPLRWEWYFGDGTTAVGRQVTHTFGNGGSFEVRLLVRDNDGGVASVTQTVEVAGDPAPCTVGQVQDCYDGPRGTQDVGSCVGGAQQCLPQGWGACMGAVLPEAEVCDDEIDNDCDGDVDDVDMDCGGPGGATGTGGVDGTAGNDDAPADGSGGSGDGGTETDTAGGADGEGGGCGCRMREPGPAAGFGALLLLLGLRRRRRPARWGG